MAGTLPEPPPPESASGGTERPPISDQQRLTVLLQDFAFVYNQMHTRMQINGRFIATSATFFVTTLILATGYAAKLIAGQYVWLLLCVPPMFWVVAILIAREDFLMLRHDHYLMTVLRPEILRILGDNPDSSHLLTFLRHMGDVKLSLYLFPISAVASGLRYAFALLGAAAALLAYLYLKLHLSSPRSSYIETYAFLFEVIFTGFLYFLIVRGVFVSARDWRD